MTFSRLWWVALVVLTVAAPFVGKEGSTLQACSVALLLPIAALAAVVGRTRGFLAVLGAAAAICVLIGAATLIAHAELRNPALPECEGLMSGFQRHPCFQGASEQATSGFSPAILVLVFGLPTVLMKRSADRSAIERRESEQAPSA